MIVLLTGQLSDRDLVSETYHGEMGRNWVIER